MKKSQKLELVKTMDKIIRNYGGDEDLIFWWLQEGVPDCASEEDYKFIAYNATEFNDLVFHPRSSSIRMNSCGTALSSYGLNPAVYMGRLRYGTEYYPFL